MLTLLSKKLPGLVGLTLLGLALMLITIIAPTKADAGLVGSSGYAPSAKNFQAALASSPFADPKAPFGLRQAYNQTGAHLAMKASVDTMADQIKRGVRYSPAKTGAVYQTLKTKLSNLLTTIRSREAAGQTKIETLAVAYSGRLSDAADADLTANYSRIDTVYQEIVIRIETERSLLREKVAKANQPALKQARQIRRNQLRNKKIRQLRSRIGDRIAAINTTADNKIFELDGERIDLELDAEDVYASQTTEIDRLGDTQKQASLAALGSATSSELSARTAIRNRAEDQLNLLSGNSSAELPK